MSLKRSPSPSIAQPVLKRASPEEAVESTHYYILCQIFNPDDFKTRTTIARCYTTAKEALNFVSSTVREWGPDVERQWEEEEENDDDEEEEEDEEETKVLLRVTTKFSELSEDGGASIEDLSPLCTDVSDGEEITITVQREKVPIYKPPPPPPIAMEEVYVVVQKDTVEKGVVVSTLHGAYAGRKEANQAARRVLRLVSAGLDEVGRIRCRHEENMDEGGLYCGIAHVGEDPPEGEERKSVELVVKRLDVR